MIDNSSGLTTTSKQQGIDMEIPQPFLKRFEALVLDDQVCTLVNWSQRKEDVCPICYEKFSDKDILILEKTCRQTFHAECILHWFESSDDGSTCPMCRANVQKSQPQSYDSEPDSPSAMTEWEPDSPSSMTDWENWEVEVRAEPEPPSPVIQLRVQQIRQTIRDMLRQLYYVTQRPTTNTRLRTTIFNYYLDMRSPIREVDSLLQQGATYILENDVANVQRLLLRAYLCMALDGAMIDDRLAAADVYLQEALAASRRLAEGFYPATRHNLTPDLHLEGFGPEWSTSNLPDIVW